MPPKVPKRLLATFAECIKVFDVPIEDAINELRSIAADSSSQTSLDDSPSMKSNKEVVKKVMKANQKLAKVVVDLTEEFNINMDDSAIKQYDKPETEEPTETEDDQQPEQKAEIESTQGQQRDSKKIATEEISKQMKQFMNTIEIQIPSSSSKQPASKSIPTLSTKMSEKLISAQPMTIASTDTEKPSKPTCGYTNLPEWYRNYFPYDRNSKNWELMQGQFPSKSRKISSNLPEMIEEIVSKKDIALKNLADLCLGESGICNEIMEQNAELVARVMKENFQIAQLSVVMKQKNVSQLVSYLESRQLCSEVITIESCLIL
jgi:hypothetical protein